MASSTLCLTYEQTPTNLSPQEEASEPATAPARQPSLPPAAGIEDAKQAAADTLSNKLGVRLTRRRRSPYETADDKVRAVISVSKRYDRDYQSYWYGHYDNQRSYFREAQTGYLVLCAPDPGRAWAIPAAVVESLIPAMNLTERPDGQTYRHVQTKLVENDCILVAGATQQSLSPYEIGGAA
jgi:hypothetical protein